MKNKFICLSVALMLGVFSYNFAFATDELAENNEQNITTQEESSMSISKMLMKIKRVRKQILKLK